MRWWRLPGLHFVLIGALLFALDARLSDAPRAAAPEPLVIDAARVESLARAWLADIGRPPSPAELDALVAAEIDDELLLREALALGFHESDALVRRRLARNMRFLDPEDGRGDDALVRAALAMGMERSDPVVRRRLVQRMQLRARAPARAREPRDAELEALLARDPERWSRPARVTLWQVYLSRDRRGASLRDDALRLRERLVADGVPPEATVARGDPFLIGHHLPARSQAELARSFGADFARDAFGLEPGVWSQPIASPYGLHLVFVGERSEGGAAPLDAVRGAAREAWFAERGDALLRDELAALRARTEIRVEGRP